MAKIGNISVKTAQNKSQLGMKIFGTWGFLAICKRSLAPVATKGLQRGSYENALRPSVCPSQFLVKFITLQQVKLRWPNFGTEMLQFEFSDKSEGGSP